MSMGDPIGDQQNELGKSREEKQMLEGKLFPWPENTADESEKNQADSEPKAPCAGCAPSPNKEHRNCSRHPGNDTGDPDEVSEPC